MYSVDDSKEENLNKYRFEVLEVLEPAYCTNTFGKNEYIELFKEPVEIVETVEPRNLKIDLQGDRTELLNCVEFFC